MRPSRTHTFALVALAVMQAFLLADMLWRWRLAAGAARAPASRHGAAADAASVKDQVCRACSSIDPVSDPAYNMREIAKQSVLLEEHLSVLNKYCPDCCVKHLLHLHGLATEAAMLAGKDVDKYPLLDEAPAFYQRCLDTWERSVVGADPAAQTEPRLSLATELREFRKRIVQEYFLHPE